MPGSNEYMAKYMTERYHRRRAEWIARLGGECVRCQAEEDLQFDHINREEKSFNVAKALSGWAESRIAPEMEKIQLLCRSCHKKKTNENLDHGKGETKHGTYWRYRKYKCRCEDCTKANSAYLKQSKKNARDRNSSG